MGDAFDEEDEEDELDVGSEDEDDEEDEDEVTQVHLRVSCDGCGQGPPLRGVVMKCMDCDDFDFCGRCYQQRDRYDHPVTHHFRPRRTESRSGLQDMLMRL